MHSSGISASPNVRCDGIGIVTARYFHCMDELLLVRIRYVS